MATQLVLCLQLDCSSDGSQTQETLTLDSLPESVADLKQRIQDELSIPKSGQSLFLGNGQPLLDSEQISGLYLRSGDTLRLTFISRVDVEQICNIINRTLRPTLELLRSRGDAKLMQESQDSSILLKRCLSSLTTLSFKILLPWNNVQTEANRRFLLQEGALDIVLDIYTILLPLDLHSRRDLLQSLEIFCLYFLWNFSETAYARQLVVEKGGFDMALKSLMHPSSDEIMYKMYDVFDTAVGAISNICELDCCQLPMARNTPALQHLLCFAIQGPSLNIFTKILVANLFFRLSHGQETHQYLVTKSVLEQLVQFSENQDVAIRYALGLTYSRLVLFSHDSIGQEFLQKISECMRSFLLKVKPSVVCKLEERYQYNWITMIPFVNAAYTCGVEAVKLSDARLKKAQSSATFSEEKEISSAPQVDSSSLATTLSLAFVLFALKVETEGSNNTRLLIKQGFLDYVTTLHWGLDNGWHEQCQWVQEQVRRISKLPVPRLSSIARGKLARINRQYSGQINQ